MNHTIKPENFSPPPTVAMPSHFADPEGDHFETESPNASNWRTRFEGNWKDRMKYLLENNHETGKDVVFVVGPTKKEIKAHKFILAVSSIEFKNLFDNSESIPTSGIILAEEDPKAFEILIRYIYLDELVDVDKYSMNELLTLRSLAEKYEFQNLNLECIKEIQKKIKSDWKNGLQMIKRGDLCQNDEIIESSINSIASNIETVFKSTEFLKLSKRSLRVIIGSSKLPIKESKVLEAATCWAKHKINKGQGTTRTDISPFEIRSVLGDAISDIRFPLFTVEEFLCTVTVHNLLDDADHAKILNYITRKAYNIGNPEDPEWDTWPYMKEPRARPPAILQIMGPPNPPTGGSEEPPDKRQRIIESGTSDANSPGTSTAQMSVSSQTETVAATESASFTHPSITAEITPQLTTVEPTNLTENSLEAFQRIRLIPSFNPAIWDGVLECIRPPGVQPAGGISCACAIHCRSGTVDATNWAEKLTLKFAQTLPVGQTKRVDYKSIFIVPNSVQSIAFLTTALTKYHAIVIIPLKTQPASVMAFELSYVKEQQLFAGTGIRNPKSV